MSDLQNAGIAGGEKTTNAAAGTVAKTKNEAAKLLKIHVRTLGEWLLEPGFPGKAGTTGKQDGHFPIAAIQRWHAARTGSDGRSTAIDEVELSTRREMLQIDRDRKLAELERDTLGTLIDAEEVTRFVTFVISNSKQVLQELPDRIIARLPGGMSPKARKVIRQVAAMVTRETLENLAQLIVGDADDKEDRE